MIFNVTPISDNAACGIFEGGDGGVYGHNRFAHNIVNDAYCGVGYAGSDTVESGRFFNTLYATINVDQNPVPPPPVEP